MSSEAPIEKHRDGDNGANCNHVNQKFAPVCDAFRDGGKIPRFRDDGIGDGLFDGWDDGRVMIEEIVLDVVKECIFHLTEDRFDHLFVNG